MAIHPICEYVDCNGDALLVRVRLRGADLPAGTRYYLVLRSRAGQKIAFSVASATLRVSTTGEWSRSAFDFAFPLNVIPNGEFNLQLACEGVGSFALDPSAGVLAEARPRQLADSRLCQVFPAAGKPATRIRVSPNTRLSRARWRARNVVRDVAFSLRLRRFSWIRTARMVTRPFVPSAGIWLIGERPETARDNGAALFEYLRKNRPDDPIYYIINRDSIMRNSVEQLGNVVLHSSFHHKVLMLHAEVLANAYSIKHMLPRTWHPGAYMKQATWRLGARRVYLKHGIHLSPYAVKRANGGYDLFLTAGEPEHAALAETSGYSHQLAQTGLARFDRLLMNGTPASRQILFMPTWRRYLVPPLFRGAVGAQVPYEGSAYERFMNDFLNSDELEKVLADYDLNLIMVPHYNLAANFEPGKFAGRRVEVRDAKTADIPALLRESDALITDYSSVHFDVAYVGSPIIYAQFDRDDYGSMHGASSWFDFEADGFGPVVTDVRGVIDALRRYAQQNFVREDFYTERLERVFAYRDTENRARIAQAIDALLEI